MLLYRRLRYGYAFRKIPLTRRMYAIVDPDDYYRLSEYKWHVSGAGYDKYYAVRKGPNKNGTRGEMVQMHREVANTPEGLLCDHINGDRLDNRKANLRPATCTQNVRNSKKTSSPAYSKYKGVTYRSRSRKWVAMIYLSRRQVFLGSFDAEIQAAKAYDKAAKKHFGEFAKLNFKK